MGVYAVLLQKSGRRPVPKMRSVTGEGARAAMRKFFRGGGGVRFPVVAPHFSKDLVEGDPAERGGPSLPADHGAGFIPATALPSPPKGGREPVLSQPALVKC